MIPQHPDTYTDDQREKLANLVAFAERLSAENKASIEAFARLGRHANLQAARQQFQLQEIYNALHPDGTIEAAESWVRWEQMVRDSIMQLPGAEATSKLVMP